MKYNTNPVKGMRDFLPSEVRLREYLTGVIARTYAQHGFQRIETPAVLHIELLQNSEGGENLALIFKILKRGEKLDLAGASQNEDELVDSGLRYDLTLPLARFYANQRAHLPEPFKALQIGTVYRAERPQKGRFRAFTQCDIDILGEAGEIAELELIHATAEALKAIGLRGFTVEVSDRRVLGALVAALGLDIALTPLVAVSIDKADKIGWEKVIEELAKQGVAQTSAAGLVGILQNLSLGNLAEHGVSSSVVEALRGVVEAATTFAGGEYNVRFEPTLVRGMGYYTGMVFEITMAELGLSVAGGGRYDGLVSKLCGQSVPAVGFSIGFERIVLLLEQQGFAPPVSMQCVALLYSREENSALGVLTAAQTLRQQGYAVRTLPERAKLGKQLSQLEAEGFAGYYSLAKRELVMFELA
ncbi:MAG: Histidine--tRNA ligase [Firmicutes bacterium]|nr:Histidine--tRNA ligase [candidate division NPL-UPA2 bacterium]MBT9156171.1 Histidine--tRNA ligase [candidate division NPL-UPA2 bacterium]